MPDLILTSYGDPTDPSTWSGTPANLCAALSRQGLDVVGLDYSRATPRAWDRMARLVERASGRLTGSAPARDRLRTAAARKRAGDWVTAQAERLGCRDVLHTGTLALPMSERTPGQRQFIYTDTTWNLWASSCHSDGDLDPAFVAQSDELERQAYEQASHIFPIGAYVTSDLTTHYGVPADMVTPVGTGLGVVTPYAGPKDYGTGLVLTAARARSEDKGVHLLIEALRIARRTRPELRLVVVGSEANAALAGDAPNVEVTGFVSVERLQDLFESAALFAMPALNEPWGLVYLEAMACKTPVLGLRRNALPEMTDDGRLGFLVDDPDPEQLSAALLDALSRPARLEAMGMEAQRYVLDRYSWDRTAELIAERISRR